MTTAPSTALTFLGGESCPATFHTLRWSDGLIVQRIASVIRGNSRTYYLLIVDEEGMAWGIRLGKRKAVTHNISSRVRP